LEIVKRKKDIGEKERGYKSEIKRDREGKER
jgi:hypothetical protein